MFEIIICGHAMFLMRHLIKLKLLDITTTYLVNKRLLLLGNLSVGV